MRSVMPDYVTNYATFEALAQFRKISARLQYYILVLFNKGN